MKLHSTVDHGEQHLLSCSSMAHADLFRNYCLAALVLTACYGLRLQTCALSVFVSLSYCSAQIEDDGSHGRRPKDRLQVRRLLVLIRLFLDAHPLNRWTLEVASTLELARR